MKSGVGLEFRRTKASVLVRGLYLLDSIKFGLQSDFWGDWSELEVLPVAVARQRKQSWSFGREGEWKREDCL